MSQIAGLLPMKWLAPAKINLSLRVLGKRDDGFHEIETLMAPISLADEIVLEPADASASSPLEFICNDPSLPAGADNLAFRAAELFRARAGVSLPALRLVLKKHIPHGAGLGGGSSDAASVLMALNEFSGSRLSVARLAALAAELGSDVPFFVYRSAAFCRGRGEKVDPVPTLGSLPLLLLKPPFPVPTPFAYRHWRDSRELPGVPYAAQRSAWGELVNDLERPVFEKYLFLADLKTWLLAQPEVAGALMSGSGSTTFAVLCSPEVNASALAERACTEFGEVWTCHCSTVGQ